MDQYFEFVRLIWFGIIFLVLFSCIINRSEPIQYDTLLHLFISIHIMCLV